MRIPIYLLLFAAIATAQTPGRIEGRVVSITGEPVRKATVRINGSAVQRGQQPQVHVEVTGSDGGFIVESVAPGQYTATAQRTGFVNAPNASGVVNITSFPVASGEVRRGVEIKLAPLVAINGSVMDADGDPVMNVQIRLMRYAYANGRLRLQNTGGANTDDRGQFRLTNVNAGRYYIVADDLSGRTANLGGNEIRGRSAVDQNMATYYPSAADARGAVMVEAGTAEVSNVVIRMRRGRTFSVKGTMVDEATGAPVQGQVQVFDKADLSGSALNSLGGNSGPGTFELRLPPGDYTLMVRSNLQPAPPPPPPAFSPGPVVPAPPQALRLLTGRLDVGVGNADVVGLVMRLSTGAEITG
ncbi:MAG: carboxypeptidase-like regulatory domain-containing protein, partial [Acidobacteriota bacterium]